MTPLEVTVRPFLFNFGDDQIETGVALDWVCVGGGRSWSQMPNTVRTRGDGDDGDDTK